MAAIPSAEVVELLAADAKTEKRAAWEAFEFTLLEDGEVEVANGSYENPEDHTYTVHVEGGIPAYCSCPAWDYQEGPCKHMVAVAIREPILEASSTSTPIEPDGGKVTGEGETCPNENEMCEGPDDEMPCFQCYCEGYEVKEAEEAKE